MTQKIKLNSDATKVQPIAQSKIINDPHPHSDPGMEKELKATAGRVQEELQKTRSADVHLHTRR